LKHPAAAGPLDQHKYEVAFLKNVTKEVLLTSPLRGNRVKADRKESTSFSEEKEAKRLCAWGRWDRDCL